MKQRIPLDGQPVDLWAADTRLGPMVTGPALDRLVREEFERLSAAAAGGRTTLLTDAEVASLRETARKTVLARLRAASTNIVAEDDPLASIRAEFGTQDAAVDERSGARAHAMAMTIAAAAAVDGKVTERGYWQALNAIAGDEGEVGRRYADDDAVSLHCESAEAIANLAAERLRLAGVHQSAADYPDRYVKEVEAVGRQFNLEYGKR